MKPEPCNLALKLLDADEACGACGHLARTHRNHASYVDPSAPAKPRQYYFRVSECRAHGADDPACVCWHDEGTGPLSDGRGIKDWRERPAEIVAGILRVAEANEIPTPHVPVELPPVSKPEASTRVDELALRAAATLKPADEFDGWTPWMLRAAIAFERATVAELRLDLHREREQRQALERGIVEIRHVTCAALTWATDSKPDVANTRRAVEEVVRRLRNELAATRNDVAYNATLIRERDEWKARAVKLVELRENLISQRDTAMKELRDVTDVIAAVLSVPIGSKPGSASTMVRTLIGELVGLRAERERGIHARSNEVQRRAAESAVLALAWARDPARTREEIESQIKNLEAIDSPSAGYAVSVLRWTIANPNRRTSADFDAARRAIDAGRELP